MAHSCPYCGMLCHCRGDIDDMDLGLEPPGGCIHYTREGCDEFEDDDEEWWEGTDIDYEDEDLGDPTAHDPLAGSGIVEQPKNLEDE